MEKLGIDTKLLLAQIVNFSILLVVLTKLLYKPILKVLAARQKKIEEGLIFAEKAKLEAEKLAKKREELFKETRDEAKVILENVKKEGLKLKDEIVADGKKDVEKLQEKMKKELTAGYERLERELTAKTVDIAVEMIKRLLPDLVTGETQHQLIRRELTKLEKSHGHKS
jgi:F-type H+-transporting ATPase subunit b